MKTLRYIPLQKLLIPLIALLLSFIITIFIYGISYAQLAVTDPTALAQAKLTYIETINTVSELRENVQAAKDMIFEAQKMKEGIGEMRTMMSTVYNNTFGLVGELERLRVDILKTPAEMQAFLDEFKANADCLFDDMDKYQQVETIYKARYIFVDSVGGTPNYPADDPHIWEDGSQTAGQIGGDPVQLQENPCGHSVTTNGARILNKIEQEKAILERITGIYNKTEEEKTNLENFYTEMEKKVQNTETEKESLDTMKAILWKMNSHLESIDKTLLDITHYYISTVHDPNAVAKAPHLSQKSMTEAAALGIKYGEATEYNKKTAQWWGLGKTTKKQIIR